jgi:hypothetical protein
MTSGHTTDARIRPLALPRLLPLSRAATAGADVAAVIELDPDVEGVMAVGDLSPLSPYVQHT